MRTFPAVEGVEHRFVDVGGLRLHVAEAGGGEPLLMLHGWPQHWYEWRCVIPRLADRYRLICPDLRGFGWSDAPAKGYEKEQLATDVIRLLDVLGLRRVKLVGHDWGGWVGFLVCLREPSRIEGFLALNIAHPWQGFEPAKLATLWRFWYQVVLASPGVGAWLLRRRPGLVRRIIGGWAVSRDAWTREELDEFSAVLQEPARAHASALLYRTFLLREMVPILRGRYASSRLRVPTLLLFGVGDPAISTRLLGGYETHADDMRVELVADCGHFIAEEQPDLVAARARELFGATAAGA